MSVLMPAMVVPISVMLVGVSAFEQERAGEIHRKAHAGDANRLVKVNR